MKLAHLAAQWDALIILLHHPLLCRSVHNASTGTHKLHVTLYLSCLGG